jgi:hypothetical protein
LLAQAYFVRTELRYRANHLSFPSEHCPIECGNEAHPLNYLHEQLPIVAGPVL